MKSVTVAEQKKAKGRNNKEPSKNKLEEKFADGDGKAKPWQFRVTLHRVNFIWSEVNLFESSLLCIVHFPLLSVAVVPVRRWFCHPSLPTSRSRVATVISRERLALTMIMWATAPFVSRGREHVTSGMETRRRTINIPTVS